MAQSKKEESMSIVMDFWYTVLLWIIHLIFGEQVPTL